jgi:hypothetical protein
MNREGLKYKTNIIIGNKINLKMRLKMMNIYHKRESERNKRKVNLIIKIIRIFFNPITISTINLKNSFNAFLYIDNKMVSFLSGYITQNNKIIIPRHAIDSDYYQYCVGSILITDTIKWLMENTLIRDLDLSRGAEPYKYTLGGKEHYNYSFLISL